MIILSAAIKLMPSIRSDGATLLQEEDRLLVQA